MIAHRCFLDDAPNGFIQCLCVRGIDHEEDMFDIPLTEEEE